jgi:hypothetical protein
MKSPPVLLMLLLPLLAPLQGMGADPLADKLPPHEGLRAALQDQRHPVTSSSQLPSETVRVDVRRLSPQERAELREQLRQMRMATQAAARTKP